MSAYAVTSPDGRRIGTVMRIDGNPPKERWYAASIHASKRAAFPTRATAKIWVCLLDAENRAKAEGLL